MAYLEDLTTPATGDAAMRRLKTRLVAAGWSVIASGAWMRLRPGSGTRELLIIRGASSTTWTVRYSAAGFSGGAPVNATTAPTAADQQNLISAAQLLPADGGYRWLICAEDAAPWHFWAGAIPTVGGAPRTLVGLWPMREGSYPSADPEPYVVMARYEGTNVATNVRLGQNGIGPNGFVAGAWRNTLFTILYTQSYGSAVGVLGAATSGEELPAEILVAAQEISTGARGYVRDARSVLSTTAATPHGTHLEQGSRYWVRIGDLWLPWGSTPPAL